MPNFFIHLLCLCIAVGSTAARAQEAVDSDAQLFAPDLTDPLDDNDELEEPKGESVEESLDSPFLGDAEKVAKQEEIEQQAEQEKVEKEKEAKERKRLALAEQTRTSAMGVGVGIMLLELLPALLLITLWPIIPVYLVLATPPFLVGAIVASISAASWVGGPLAFFGAISGLIKGGGIGAMTGGTIGAVLGVGGAGLWLSISYLTRVDVRQSSPYVIIPGALGVGVLIGAGVGAVMGSGLGALIGIPQGAYDGVLNEGEE